MYISWFMSYSIILYCIIVEIVCLIAHIQINCTFNENFLRECSPCTFYIPWTHSVIIILFNVLVEFPKTVVSIMESLPPVSIQLVDMISDKSYQCADKSADDRKIVFVVCELQDSPKIKSQYIVLKAPKTDDEKQYKVHFVCLLSLRGNILNRQYLADLSGTSFSDKKQPLLNRNKVY